MAYKRSIKCDVCGKTVDAPIGLTSATNWVTVTIEMTLPQYMAHMHRLTARSIHACSEECLCKVLHKGWWTHDKG